MERTRQQREAAMFGYWGGGINVVDGRYTYFCYPQRHAEPGPLPVHADARRT